MSRILLLAAFAMSVWACAADSNSVFDDDAEDTQVRPGLDVDPVLDTDEADTRVEDTGDEDTAPDAGFTGEFLDPCASDAECLSGFCVVHEGERVCTERCAGTCAEGWECRFVGGSGADVIRICVPGNDLLCTPCASDLDCGGFGDLCVRVGDSGYCTRACDEGVVCPDGYLCDPVTSVEGETGNQCIPSTGRCSCPPELYGTSRDCVRANAFGICAGVEACQETAGWSLCSAPLPGEEICDGLDNDCDNRIDEGLTDRPCSSTPNPLGSCEGTETCTGNGGWVCDAPTATIEVCDGLDNDCNGEIDDGLCYDGNPCTRDICDPDSDSCTFAPFNGPCDDGNICTINTLCIEGACVGEPLDCDDGNACTADSCSPSTGCRNRISPGAPCETGNLCTQDVCDGAGLCVTGGPVECGTPDVCLAPACDPATGCTTERLTGGRCDDGDACTVNDECSNGICVGGTPYCMGRSCSECDGEWGVSIEGTCIELFNTPQCTCFCF